MTNVFVHEVKLDTTGEALVKVRQVIGGNFHRNSDRNFDCQSRDVGRGRETGIKRPQFSVVHLKLSGENATAFGWSADPV